MIGTLLPSPLVQSGSSPVGPSTVTISSSVPGVRLGPPSVACALDICTQLAEQSSSKMDTVNFMTFLQNWQNYGVVSKRFKLYLCDVINVRACSARSVSCLDNIIS